MVSGVRSVSTAGSEPRDGRPGTLARYRFLLSRRWLGLLLVALVLAVTCVQLGRWQLHRLAFRHGLNDLVTRSIAAAPVRPATLVAPGRGPRSRDVYRRIRVTGTYDRDHRLLVRNRPFEGAVGYYVLVPLVTGDGTAVLVNRGWVASGRTAGEPADVPRLPVGTITVVGRVRASEPASTTGTPPRGQVTRIDEPTIARALPYAVYGGYLDLVRETPKPPKAPQPLDPPETSEGPHLAYAFQWFLFAAMALGGYGLLARREADDRDAAATGVPRTPSRVLADRP